MLCSAAGCRFPRTTTASWNCRPMRHRQGFAEWAGLGDPVIEINLTPNRQDCCRRARHRARPFRRGHGQVQRPAIKPIRANSLLREGDGRGRHAMSGFALRLVRGVKNARRPEWLQRRLASIGLRPINALVDITNRDLRRARPLRVRREKVRAILSCAAPAAGPAGARRPHPRSTAAWRDRGRSRCQIARRHHGRRGFQLRREHHGRADRDPALWNEINIAQTGRKLGINSDALPLSSAASIRPSWCRASSSQPSS